MTAPGSQSLNGRILEQQIFVHCWVNSLICRSLILIPHHANPNPKPLIEANPQKVELEIDLPMRKIVSPLDTRTKMMYSTKIWQRPWNLPT